MKKQTNHPQKTHGKTTKVNHSKEQIQTQDKELLNLKSANIGQTCRKKSDKKKIKSMENKKLSENNGKTHNKKLLSLKAGLLA